MNDICFSVAACAAGCSARPSADFSASFSGLPSRAFSTSRLRCSLARSFAAELSFDSSSKLAQTSRASFISKSRYSFPVLGSVNQAWSAPWASSFASMMGLSSS